jgi:hypothetical protein
MMRSTMLLCLFALSAAPLAAQVRPDPERLRDQVVQRFLENYRTQAGLTDEQYGKLEAVVRRQWQARRDLQERERNLVAALQSQLRPGVAANRDSVTRLLDNLTALQRERIERLETEQAEVKVFLDPVQRAQLVLAWARLERQVQDLIQQRMNQGVRRPQ